jgi:hypothetical protein
MTEPSAGVVPGGDAARPTPSTGDAPVTPADPGEDGAPTGARPDDSGTQDMARFAQLQGRPVTEHVEVFEAEHTRLQAELDTIDRL